MNAKAVWDIFWDIVIVDGWSVLWRTSLMAVFLGLAGILMAALSYKLFHRADKLKLDWKHEKYYERCSLALWFVGLPLLGVTLGALIGGWWAGGFLIKTKKLGERIGIAGFKVVATGVASANFKGTENEKAQMARAYMCGEQRISIKELANYSSHHAGELSAESICKMIAASKEGTFHHGTVWVVEKTLDTVAYLQLGDEGDVLYKLATKVAEHDRLTDNDGQVTVEEISEVACKNFLDKGVGKLWTALMLQLIIPVFFCFILLPVLPPMGAWAVRKTKAWWQARQEAKQ